MVSQEVQPKNQGVRTRRLRFLTIVGLLLLVGFGLFLAAGNLWAWHNCNAAKQAMEIGQAIQIITDASRNRPSSDSTSSADNSGYNDADRKAMDRALQSVQ